MIKKELPAVMTIEQFCELTGCNANAARKRCKEGKLPAQKVMGRWWLSRDLVFEKLIDQEEKELNYGKE